MPADPKKTKWWQISLRTLLIVTGGLPVIAGLFSGTFGEPARESAVRLLAQVTRVLAPTACVAMIILFVLGVGFLIKRLRN